MPAWFPLWLLLACLASPFLYAGLVLVRMIYRMARWRAGLGPGSSVQYQEGKVWREARVEFVSGPRHARLACLEGPGGLARVLPVRDLHPPDPLGASMAEWALFGTGPEDGRG